MGYSKRWELVHLLGGRCVECGEENFGVLEIDHKFNDGDIERLYYTKSEKRYLNNPVRAKQRLQILCKKCHESKHHGVDESEISSSQKRHEKMVNFMSVVKSLEGVNRKPVKETDIVTELVKIGFGADEAIQYIRRMLRECSIYESVREGYNTV